MSGRTLRAEAVSLRRGGRMVVDAVSLEAPPGAVTAVTGPSGAGKTSLLFMLSGLVEPDLGRVFWDGRELQKLGRAERPAISFVPQSYGLVESLEAAENVAVALQARGVRGRELDTRTAAALESVGLAGHDRRLVDELSGGQRQRLAVARGLVSEPPILIADEPTAELDATNRALVLELLLRHAATGAVVVLSTHDPDVVDACERVVHLLDGRVQPEGAEALVPVGAAPPERERGEEREPEAVPPDDVIWQPPRSN